MKLKSLKTGECLVVRATTRHSASSYGKPVWVDVENNAYCQQGLERISGFEIVDQRRELGEKLKSIRKEKGLNKNHLMKQGMRVETINSIEEGERNYTIDKLLDYLSMIGTDLTFTELLFVK